MTEINLSGVVWRKSTRSQQNGACVEVGTATTSRIAVRDSKDPDGPKLMFSAKEWTAFVEGIKTGEFDL